LSYQLKDEPEFRSAFNTLELFAYGTFGDYTSKRGDYLELTAVQESKLKQLSVLSLAAHQRTVSYATLQAALAVDSMRALEDLIIETIYAVSVLPCPCPCPSYYCYLVPLLPLPLVPIFALLSSHNLITRQLYDPNNPYPHNPITLSPYHPPCPLSCRVCCAGDWIPRAGSCAHTAAPLETCV
jgi:hypothetical protein